MLAALDIQHRGKPSHLADRGAIWPQGADLAHVQVEEVDVTHRYALAADHALRLAGWDCALLSDGTYTDRWARADALGARVYVACHVDSSTSPNADRGTVYYDPRSPRGKDLAGEVARELREVLAGAFSPGWPIHASPAVPGPGPYACISGVKAVALCYEPGFLSTATHREVMLKRPEVFGTALAQGIAAWGKR